ncbi:MAG TPA: hypothetical protein VI544_01965, partial [Candidatus Nanoarchaeia archaeon]|nr:hypothetical protein [Candidatus Nanoarchaeia archaeon]
DKRNSERLAGLLNQYMKSGQYIVITHNDAIIMDSDVLYGVSMHDGITKILSLDLSKNANIQQAQETAQAVAREESLIDAPQEIQLQPEQNPFREDNSRELGNNLDNIN